MYLFLTFLSKLLPFIKFNLISLLQAGLILLGSIAGIICVGGLAALVISFWKKRKFKALNYLKELLEHMLRLKRANEALLGFLDLVDADSGAILSKIESMKANLRTGSQRYRAANAKICSSAIDSSEEVITHIDQVLRLNTIAHVSSKTLD
jgi:hypothetical protein